MSRHEEAISDLLRHLLPILWQGLIHERLSARILLNINDTPKISSNMCFTLNPDSALPAKESAIRRSTANNNPGYPRRTSRTTTTPPPSPTATSRASGRSSPSSSMSSSLQTRTSRGSAISTRRVPEGGLKSKSIENVCVQKGEGKLRHLVMAGAKHIEFAGNFTLLYMLLAT